MRVMHDRFGETSERVDNETYKEDIRYTMLFCKWVLKPIGIWPLIYDQVSPFEKVISILLNVLCFSALCFVLIPSTLHIFLQEKDINMKIKLFGPVGFCLTSTIKYCYFGIRGKSFGKCIRHVENDWKCVKFVDYREIMMASAYIGRSLTLICAIFLYVGGLSYHTVLPIFSKVVVSENVTIRMLMYPGYNILFDPQASPAYEILFTYHCIFALITYNITTAACSLAAIFVTHACGQVQIVMLQLENLIDEKLSVQSDVEERLTEIVKQHVAIIRFSGHVEEVLREICLMELVASTLIICLLEYYCMTEWANSDAVAIFTYVILLMSFTFNIFIFCYIGELLMEQCRKIGETSYKIDWYLLPSHKARGLILMIAMSHYPPKLTAGKFIDLSLNTFGSVLKSSVVYLNLLRTVTE